MLAPRGGYDYYGVTTVRFVKAYPHYAGIPCSIKVGFLVFKVGKKCSIVKLLFALKVM